MDSYSPNDLPGEDIAKKYGYTLVSHSANRRSAEYLKGILVLSVRVYREDPYELHASLETSVKAGLVEIGIKHFSFPHPRFCLFENYVAEAGFAARRALGDES